MGNAFGQLFRISTWGESHGGGVGVVLDGCPPCVRITAEEIQVELDRRRPGQSKIVTPRQEADQVEILSGVFQGLTTGAPIGLLIRNNDAKSKDYENIKKLLQEKQKQNDRAAVLLSNVKLYSIDYSPSPFVRTNRPNPSFPTQQAQDGIEGYAVVKFNIKDDGSTSDQYISDSSPGKYFDEVSLESAKNLRYAFREPTNEREHSYRFAFTLNERSRKLPNAYFTCLDLIKKTRFSEAKSCAQSRNKFTENVLGMAYKIIIAEADFYLGDRDGAIDMLYKICLLYTSPSPRDS